MSKASILSLLAVLVTVIAGGIYLFVGAQILPDQGLSPHGWIALGLGISFSIIVGGGLSAILIISRRRGFDEAAHEISQQIDPGARDR